MQQYREGQKLQGSDGNIYVVRNGVPTLANAPAMGPAIGNDPKLPGALTGQSLQNTRTQQEIANNPLNVASTQQSIAASQNSVRQSQIGNVQELRKEFNALPEVKEYSAVLTQLGKALRASPGKQGDLSVIYAYAKAMDPGSVVREGEMDMAKETASIVSQLKQKYKSFLEGNGLPPEVRQGLIREIGSAATTFNDAYTQQYIRYREQAQALGADPKQVVGNHLGDGFRPLVQDYNRRNNSQVPEISADGRGAVLGGDTGLIGEDGGTHTVTDPRLAGANEGINALLKARRPVAEIVSYLKDRGADPAQIAALVPQLNKAQAFIRSNPGFKGDFNVDIERRTEQNNAWQNFANSDVGTGLGLGLNAAGGGIPGALSGNQDAINIARETHPKSAFLGEVGGAIGGTMALNKGLGAVLPKGFNFLSNPATRLGVADAGYGATYGATQNPDAPLRGAALGAGAALAGNVIGSKIVAPLGRGTARALGYNPAPALSRADDMVAAQTVKADPVAVQARMQEAADLGMPFTLADADTRLRSLGGSVVRKSNDAFSLADSAIGNRGLGQVDRLTGLVEGNLGPRLNLPTFKADVLKSAQTKSRPLYESAKNQSPVDDAEIAELLRTPAGQRAARSGYDEAMNNGEPVGNLVQEVDSITGEVRLVGQPSWPVLQRMKFALDAMPDQESLARRFNSRLGQLNPDFKKANLTYAKEMRRGDIAEAGYNAASPNVRPPELGSTMSAPRNMKEPDLFRQAYGSNLVDRIRGMRDAANPYEMASISSPDQLAKMQAISPNLSNRFGLARGLEGDMAATNRELFGGSPTAPRQEADKMFESGALGDALDFTFSVASGTPPISAARSQLMAGRGMFGAARDALRMGVGNAAKKKADQLAPILFNPDAEQNLFALTELMARKQARDEYVRRTGMLGSGIVAPISVGLYGQQ